MSKSLKIQNGDLVIGAGRTYESVRGVNKLAQDLRLWVLERIGIDEATPTYGNRLDGGIINGVRIPSYIGQISTFERAQEIRAEVVNLLSRYQQMQLAKIKREAATNSGRHTLDEDETLNVINSVQVVRNADQVIVKVNCSTMSGINFDLIIPA